MKAMIFAAGLGTRLRPLTDTMPKALVPVGGVPMLDRVILKLKDAGIKDFVINTHHFSDQIVNHLEEKDNFGCRIDLSIEQDHPFETGGGIKAARRFLENEDTFLVHNVDILSNLDISSFCSHNLPDGSLALLLVSSRESSRYLLFDEEMKLKGWMNSKTGEIKSPFKNLDPNTCTWKAFSGIHLISNKVFPLMENEPEVFSIIDFYLKNAAQYSIYGIEVQELKLIDIGKREALSVAEGMVDCHEKTVTL